MILRRLYLYLVSAAALGLLVAGLALLGDTILLFVFNDPSAQYSRTQLAGYTAMVVVALPVWAIHFWFARRFALRDPSERSSALRRLYLYWACLGSSIGTLVSIAVTAADVIRPLVDSCPPQPAGSIAAYVPCAVNQNWLTTSQAAWVGVVFAAVWSFHFRIAAADCAAVGEQGASATLRRWYMYPALLVGLLTMLSGISQTLETGWLKIVASHLADYRFVGDSAGLALAGFVVWSVQTRVIAQHHLEDDRHSTLRALEGFIGVAVSIAIALGAAAQMLYYALARALGVTSPGGVGSGDLVAAVAAPASQFIVYGVAWVLIRRRLARDAGMQEADRQAGIRRLYTNLAALVSLAAWAAGAGGLLWNLVEQVEAPLISVRASDWRDPVSLWVTLLVVGLAVWLAHWRHAPWAADRQSLSRRLYVWAALLGSVLAVLAGGVGMINAILQQAFSASPRLNDPANLDFGHYLAVVLVAAGVAAYHWRVLRADGAARPAKPIAPLPEAPALQPHPAAPAAPVEALPPGARRYALVVSGATDDDIHQALAGLPPQASYRLTSNGHENGD